MESLILVNFFRNGRIAVNGREGANATIFTVDQLAAREIQVRTNKKGKKMRKIKPNICDAFTDFQRETL